MGKKVLVTGHTGFKGSWLSLWLLELGAEVIGYALDPYTDKDFFVRTNLSEKITDIRGDIRNLSNLKEVFSVHKPEIVFHLAAQAIVRDSYEIPLDTFEINSIGTANILECIRITKSVSTVIIITTDKVYENKEMIWGYRENDPLGGHDPYSSSKACAEIIVDSYRKSFFKNDESNIKIASARAGNVIGGGDWQNNRIIPDCIRSFLEDKDVVLRNPNAIRPWQHVLEALGGYLLLAKKLSEKNNLYDCAWNFGPKIDSIKPVEKLTSIAAKKWGNGKISKLNNQEDTKHESNLLILDISKAIFNLGWVPVLTLEECIETTIKWYKQSINNPDKNMYNFSKTQIEKYFQLANERKINWMSSE